MPVAEHEWIRGCGLRWDVSKAYQQSGFRRNFTRRYLKKADMDPRQIIVCLTAIKCAYHVHKNREISFFHKGANSFHSVCLFMFWAFHLNPWIHARGRQALAPPHFLWVSRQDGFLYRVVSRRMKDMSGTDYSVLRIVFLAGKLILSQSTLMKVRTQFI